MSFDRIALLGALRSIEAEIRPIKAVLGVKWTRPMHEEQRRLCWLRKKATEILMVLAHARGRTHCVPTGVSAEAAKVLHAEAWARYVEVSP